MAPQCAIRHRHRKGWGLKPRYWFLSLQLISPQTSETCNKHKYSQYCSYIIYIYRSNDSSNTDHSQTARSELNAASNSKSSPWANHTSSFSFCKKPTRIAKALQVSCFQHLWTNEIEANSRTSRPLPDKQRRVCIGCLAV